MIKLIRINRVKSLWAYHNIMVIGFFFVSFSFNNACARAKFTGERVSARGECVRVEGGGIWKRKTSIICVCANTIGMITYSI